MKVFPSLVVAFLVLLTLAFVEASLEEVCKKVVQIDPSPESADYYFCVTSLQVVPESHTADTRGLAIIATNLTIANVTYNINKFKELLNSKKVSNDSKSALSVCVDTYGTALDAAMESIEAIKSHHNDVFMDLLSSLTVNIETCIDAWGETKDKPLMPKENDDANKIGGVALAIAVMLQ